jgi:hypothetical protein
MYDIYLHKDGTKLALKTGSPLPPAFRPQAWAKQQSVSRLPKEVVYAVEQQGFCTYKTKTEVKLAEGDLASRMLATARREKKK